MIKTDFLNLHSNDTSQDHQARRRAEAASKLFGGNARTKGLGLNFDHPGTAAAKPSGLSSTLDLYAPVSRAEDAQREEAARRMDALPLEIAALPKTHAGLALDALEALVPNCT